jgi:outer membrane protein assembly factor BamB
MLLLLITACGSDSGTGPGAGGGGGAGASGGGGTSGAQEGAAGGTRDAGQDVSTTPVGGNSVLERNNHASRDGVFVQPRLTRDSAATMTRNTAFNATFTGNMWASPLFIENGPGGKGVFFAVTTGNDIHALDETTGAIVWTRNIGSSPQNSGAGCGSIHPIGIISTPVIDANSRTIYVAGAIGTTQIDRHEVHALSIDDGTERPGWPVDVSTIGSGNLQFTPPPHNQRSALSLVNGILYVAYGGHVGDCGPYHGWVVGIDTANPTMRGAWATMGQGEGIWAAGGMASDGTNVFAVTGNSTVGATTHMDSEEVVRITGLGMLGRTDQNIYFPASWRTMDQQDADFGAINPVYVTVPGATPANYVAALSKDGHLYLLDSANLGGMAGHVVDFVVATGNAMAVRTVPTAYNSTQGVHIAFAIEAGRNGATMPRCPAGSPAAPVIMSVQIPAGTPPVPQVAWCASLGAPITGPITTTTDGTANPIIWYMSGSRLVGVDGDTGQMVYQSPTTDTCTVRQWTSPIAVKGRIVVGGDGHLCSWSPP